MTHGSSSTPERVADASRDAETQLMYDIVCLIDHTPDGAPAGKVLARVQNSEEWLEQYRSAYPNCELSAVPVEAPLGSAHGGLDDAEAVEKLRRRTTLFDRPTIVAEPRVFPRART